jgi:hypothetical protein
MLNKFILKRRFVIFSSYFVLALSAALIMLYPSLGIVRSQSKPLKINLSNKTKSLVVTGTKIDESDKTITHIFLKNISSKGINGFYITEGPQGKGDSSFSQVEYLYSDVKDEISPGEIFDHHASTDGLTQEDGLIVQAVFFKDGSAEGAVKFIQEVQDYRQGQKAQLERGIKLIDELLSSLIRQPFDLNNVKQKVSAFPLKEPSKTENFNWGLSTGSARLDLDFKEIDEKARSGSLEVSEGLMKLRSKLVRVLSNM